MSTNVIQAVPLVPAAVPEREERLRRAVDEHYAFIWRTLRRFGIPKDEADDLVQGVLLIFARKLETVEIGLEQPFLFRCAANVALHGRRAFQRRRALQEKAARLDGATQAGPSVEDDATRHEDLELLDELLAELPDDLRAVVVLCELEEMTLSEAAVVLGLPRGTVMSRLRRAREELTAIIVRLKRDNR
jgi:RNA polymerase sigma-70 factor, ECF subfamily